MVQNNRLLECMHFLNHNNQSLVPSIPSLTFVQLEVIQLPSFVSVMQILLSFPICRQCLEAIAKKAYHCNAILSHELQYYLCDDDVKQLINN